MFYVYLTFFPHIIITYIYYSFIIDNQRVIWFIIENF